MAKKEISVTDYVKALKHPQKAEIEAVRKMILGNKGVTEQIKWNAPSFCVNGDDRITFNFSGKEFFRLIFHCGAKTKSKPKENLFEDKSSLLQWADTDRAVAAFKPGELTGKMPELKKVVATWIKVTA